MNGPRYLLDTNIIIGFLAGVEWAVRFVSNAAEKNARFYISAVTRMELLGFPGITPEIEDAAIKIRRTARLKLPDAIVSAAAICTNAILVSADADFGRIENIELLNPAI